MLIEDAQNETTDEVLGKIKESIILLHGVFENSVFDVLVEQKPKEIFVLEGRPSLDAAKFSCRELIKRKISSTLIADNMAGFLFYKNLVKEVWLSYQSADKDGALCQIGGLILGVLGKRHKIPVNLYLNRQKIHLLGRQKEIFYFDGVKTAPNNIKGYVPLAEWIPKKYITKIYDL